jgi:hypothetical protein
MTEGRMAAEVIAPVVAGKKDEERPQEYEAMKLARLMSIRGSKWLSVSFEVSPAGKKKVKIAVGRKRPRRTSSTGRRA